MAENNGIHPENLIKSDTLTVLGLLIELVPPDTATFQHIYHPVGSEY